MGTAFRLVAVLGEVVILMAVIYALFWAVMLAALDFGLDQRYKKYIGRVMTIVGGLALIFFFAHLIAFYPRIPH
jgi:hypothetical protein